MRRLDANFPSLAPQLPRAAPFGERLFLMAGYRLELPTIQNWSCHSCSGCCRKHLVEITEEERQRILSQNWTPEDGIPADVPVIVKMGGPPWKKRWRLGSYPDGTCVFLDDKGLCRIHAKFGEPAKPLPCRIYPYAFHPAGKKVTVSLRFSCPSVVANLGKPVSQQQKDLKQMARSVVPDNITDMPPPGVTSSQRVEWSDFLRFVEALDRTLADTSVPLPVRMLRAVFWMDLVAQARFDVVLGARLGELLELITEAAKAEVPTDLSTIPEPSAMGRTMFRLLAAQYARNDTLSNSQSGLAGRWRLFRAAVKFARGTGRIPPLHDVFTPIDFATVERPFGGLTPDADEMMTRYFRVKIQGLQFCGRAYFDIPLVEGFQSMALMYPSTMWLARWLAAGAGRDRLQTDDVAQAIALADHYHAYSPAFSKNASRRRVRLLGRSGDISRLCAWYSR